MLGWSRDVTLVWSSSDLWYFRLWAQRWNCIITYWCLYVIACERLSLCVCARLCLCESSLSWASACLSERSSSYVSGVHEPGRRSWELARCLIGSTVWLDPHSASALPAAGKY